MPLPRSPPPTGKLPITSTPIPRAPTAPTAGVAGFFRPFLSTRWNSISPRILWKQSIPRSCSGLVAAGQALKDAGYGPEQEYDRNRVSVILGVTGTLELVIPLGARLGHPIWRAALKEAGVDETLAEDVVQRISDSYVPWQENSFPGSAGKRGRRPDQQTVRPGRHQLRGRRRLRQLLQRPPPRLPGTGYRQGRHGGHRRHRHFQRYFHVHVLQQNPGALPHRQCQAVRCLRRRHDSRRRSRHRGHQDGWPMQSGTATKSTRSSAASAHPATAKGKRSMPPAHPARKMPYSTPTAAPASPPAASAW